MQTLHKTAEEATGALAQKLIESLRGGKVLWLICGGSNIPFAVEALRMVRSAVPGDVLANLTIGQTDERYGEPGHADSNWQQLLGSGLDLTGITAYPMIIGEPLAASVDAYARKLDEIFALSPFVIAQFGIGLDGHIAGVLPHSSPVSDTKTVSAYEAAPFVRMSLSLPAFAHISAAYAFVYGASKHDVVLRLQGEVPLEDMPSQILKQIPEAYLYTDQGTPNT